MFQMRYKSQFGWTLELRQPEAFLTTEAQRDLRDSVALCLLP
jgi:hypothetical protein